ncbi:hypothetical protein AALA98_06880 [Lachnospiraceae bacterium 45-W7]
MKRRFNFFLIIVFVMLFSIAADVFIVVQLQNYETRFLELYGAQQDGYVNIILGQIRALGDGASEEDVTSIISSLDASASRYWTLSKGNAMLFVKSVTETNRYKGFAEGTYFASETASQFMDTLGKNQVGHQIIYLGRDRFIASGMVFDWQGEPYRVCLLTYDKVILEDNILLGCKNAIIIVLSIVLALLVILSMVMSRKLSRQEKQIADQEKHVVWQNRQIALLDEQLKREYAFSASKNVFKRVVLDEFLDKLDEKNVSPLHFALFQAASVKARDKFFEHMQLVLDNHVLRFSMDDQYALLIFAGYEKKDSSKIIDTLWDWEVHEVGNLYCEDNIKSYKSQFDQFWQEVSGQ